MSANEFGLLGPVSIPDMPPPVEECEVTDFPSLATYRAKRTEWISWYSFQRDDPNNIQRQIVGMVFLDISYRMLARPRGDFGQGPDIAARNGILAHMLDQGYVASQVLAIRRLLDRRPDVFSIRRLLDDICRNQALITQENFVAHDGSPYDPESWRSLPQDVESQIWGIEAPGLRGYLRSSERHVVFDKLSGVDLPNRSRKDAIRPDVFRKLLSWLECPEAEKLVKLSHKFFAHASDVQSRESMEYSGVLLKDIQAVQRAIVRVERAITDDILFMGVMRDVVAMQPLGFLTGLDKVYLPAELLAGMDAHWDELKEDRNNWARGYESELFAK